MSTTPKGETEGVLIFVGLVGQHQMALNSVHRDAGHQGQQRTLALAQERFWWPMMAEDCRAIVRGCPHCRAFKGEVPKAPFFPIRVYAPLELVHLRLHQHRVHHGAEQAPCGEECPPDCQDCHKGVLQALHSSFWGACKTTER